MTKITGKFFFRLTTIIFTTLFLTFVVFNGILITLVLSADNDFPKNFILNGIRVNFVSFIISAAIASLLVGVVFGLFWIKGFVNPLHELKISMNKVSKGEFIRMEETYDNKEVGELIYSFNKMVDELSHMDNLSHEYTANISHEFKTPLSTIKGYITLLEMGTESEEEKKEYISYIKNATERLTNLTNNILLLNKVDNMGIMSIVEYSLDDQIRDAVISLENELNKKNLSINIDLDEFKIESCKDLLMSVWVNLLSNAIKYTNDRGNIAIRLENNGDCAIITFTDNGIGIKEEDIEKIFERFYQADKSHNSDGNGLGMSLVKTILDKVNGEIEVQSEYGKGTTFTIKLNRNCW